MCVSFSERIPSEKCGRTNHQGMWTTLSAMNLFGKRWLALAGMYLVAAMLTLHLQPLACPDDLWGGVASDLALKVGIAALSKSGIAEDLLEDRRRGTLLH